MFPLALLPLLLKLVLLLGERVFQQFRQSVCSVAACLCLGVCLLFTRLPQTNFSAVHSVVIVCARDIRLLFKLPLKFQNVLKHTKCRSSFACNQNIKEDIPTEFGVFLCLKTKRNINRSSRKTSTRRASYIPGKLGTRKIT